MSAACHHLVYQSVATAALEAPELERVLAQSRAWNTAHGLTGVLLYSHGNILQVLEGSRAEVQAIFGRIARDRRHAHVVKLADGPIGERRFAQWSMGIRVVNAPDFTKLQACLDSLVRHVPMVTPSADPRLYALLAEFLVEDPIRF